MRSPSNNHNTSPVDTGQAYPSQQENVLLTVSQPTLDDFMLVHGWGSLPLEQEKANRMLHANGRFRKPVPR